MPQPIVLAVAWPAGHRVELLGREIGQRLVEARVHALELGANELRCAEHDPSPCVRGRRSGRRERPIIAHGACGSDRSCRSLPAMKITTIESLHADAGWRNFDFLKISHRRGHHRLERVQRELRRPRPVAGDRRAGAGPHRQGPARVGGARGADVRAAPPGDRRRDPAGHRRHRERAARRQGARARRPRLRAVRRPRARPHPPVLVALRDVPREPRARRCSCRPSARSTTSWPWAARSSPRATPRSRRTSSSSATIRARTCPASPAARASPRSTPIAT